MTMIANADAPAAAGAAPLARTSHYAWYVAVMLSLGYVLSILDRYLLGVVMEDVKHHLHLSDTQLGVLQGPSFVFMFLAASLPSGWLADNASRKRTIIGGMLCWSIATAACGMSESFGQLSAARLGIGLGEAALLPSALSLLTDYFSRDRLSRGVAIYSMGSSFGRVAAFVGGGALFALFAARGGLDLPALGRFAPWQCVFLTAGLIGFGFTFLFALTVREPVRHGTAGRRGTLREGLAFFWAHRTAYLAVFVPFGMTTAIPASLAAWSVSFYIRNHGLDAATAASIVGFTGLLFGPAGHLFGGWANDRLRQRGVAGVQPLVLAIVSVSSLMFICLFAFAPVLRLAMLAYGIGYFLLCAAGPTGYAGVQLPTPPQLRGIMSSLFLIIYSTLGLGIGPLLVGWVSDHVFNRPDQLGAALATSLAILVAIALPFALGGRGAYARAVADEETAERERHPA